MRSVHALAAGAVSDATFGLVDVMASIAAIVGAPLPADAAEDSLDCSPVWSGAAAATPPGREGLVMASAHHLLAIRVGAWKWIDGLGSGGFIAPVSATPAPGAPTGQLYDHARDPGERADRAAAEPATVERLSALLRRYRADGRSVAR